MNAKLTQFPCFAYPTTQEVKLCAAYLAATLGLYVDHIRRMNQKPSLHTLVRHNSANQEGFVDARATPGYDHPREIWMRTFSPSLMRQWTSTVSPT